MIDPAFKLPDDEAKAVMGELKRKVPRMSHTQLLTFCIAISMENARLCGEINHLREQLGIAPMKRYIPGE